MIHSFRQWPVQIYITCGLLVVAGGAMIGAFVAHEAEERGVHMLESKLIEHAGKMWLLAEETDRNGADESIAEIIADCGRRPEYESLLIKLGSLNKKELLSLQNLSDACGDFDAERKALMVSKLQTEFTHYQDLLRVLETVSTADLLPYQESTWEKIVEHERARSQLLRELSTIQKEIITELISGASVRSASVDALVKNAGEVQNLLIMHDQKADEARKIVYKP